ncbi:DivIVA domain-containing protein [Kineococcus rubinsiae]|uniref:DivIVA domain-containing protein n=1 Tax=Kineococcus rubinsiae TaxID=2609562 RepID=UPI00142F66AB|nr:DivIVA domain-containing protein [Kineococcus rubinsiae]
MTSEVGQASPLEQALTQRPHRTGRLRRGYRPADVDAFLAHAARSAGSGALTAAQVRAVGFGSAWAGYDVTATDAVLARLEDVLARRERTRALAAADQRQWAERAAALSASVHGRLGEPEGERFPRGHGLRRGYRPADVDELCDLLHRHLTGGQRLSAADVRHALFRPARGRRGYREAPVDAFFDRVVELMVAFDH